MPASPAQRRRAAVALVAGLAACGPADSGAGPDAGPVVEQTTPQGPCNAVVATVASEPGVHVAQGSPLTTTSNPPVTGAHYPVWAPWAQVFDKPVPRGNWIHNLEHGGVVLLYRCDGACPDVAAQLAAFGKALARDSACALPINARWLLTPDPALPAGTQVAAAAWDHSYRATCFDAATLSAFVQAHYGHGPEDLCADGAIAWQP